MVSKFKCVHYAHIKKNKQGLSSAKLSRVKFGCPEVIIKVILISRDLNNFMTSRIAKSFKTLTTLNGFKDLISLMSFTFFNITI